MPSMTCYFPAWFLEMVNVWSKKIIWFIYFSEYKPYHSMEAVLLHNRIRLREDIIIPIIKRNHHWFTRHCSFMNISRSNYLVIIVMEKFHLCPKFFWRDRDILPCHIEMSVFSDMMIHKSGKFWRTTYWFVKTHPKRSRNGQKRNKKCDKGAHKKTAVGRNSDTIFALRNKWFFGVTGGE